MENIDKLRQEYEDKHPENNKPLPAWDEEELKTKISELKPKTEKKPEKPTPPPAFEKPAEEAEPAPAVPTTPPEEGGASEDDGKDKTYKLTEEQLAKIMSGERPQNIFEKDLEPVEEEAEKPRTYTCMIALYQKDADSPVGVVTDLKTVRYDQDPITKLHNVDIIRATITYEDDKTEQFEYPIGDHIKIFTKREEVEIVKEERKKMKMDKGMVYKAKSIKEGGIKTRMAGELTNVLVPMRERFLVPIITIKRRNGQELVLPPRVVNI